MSSRPVFFVIGEIIQPKGGFNVILDLASDLLLAGHDVGLIVPRPHYSYPFYHSFEPTYYDPRLWRLIERRTRIGRLVRLERRARQAIDRVRPGGHEPAVVPPDSIVVIPEYCFPEIAPLYPDARVVVLAQDVFGCSRALTRVSPGVLNRLDGMLSTSSASAALVDRVAPRFHGRLSQRIDPDRFRFGEAKKEQIAYFPRKRVAEAEMLEALLRLSPILREVPICPLQNVGADELSDRLRESLLFLSFSRQEGFGLPPAEAMAAGCIVVGYTGVGGEEYFTNETGYPVPDSDIVGFAETVESVISQYRSDPMPLDAMRRAASEFILSKYSPGVASSQLLSTWEALEKHLDEVNTPGAT